MVQLLLELGADVNVRFNHLSYATPTHLAAARNHYSILSILFYYGADPFQRNSLQETPLEIALESGSDFSVYILLERGCFLTRRMANNETMNELLTIYCANRDQIAQYVMGRGIFPPCIWSIVVTYYFPFVFV